MNSSGAKSNDRPDNVRRNMRNPASRLGLLFFFAVVLQPAYCQRPPVNSSTEDTAVDPITRLEHYRKESRYPPDSRPAQNLSFDLGQIPLVDGDATRDASIARFVSDALEDGSLSVRFQVQVKTAGRYSFKTIVADEREKPLALCLLTQDLKSGTHTLTFRLYGLIVREAIPSGNVKASFQFPGIVGERLPNDQELQQFAEGKLARPPQGALKTLHQKYVTQKYSPNGFSDREWDSAEKRNRIQELEAEVKQYKARQP
ncbi:MAG: hypothetical protein JNM27_00555 [Leptospirales bacterium]|nr:hypothetical protein [Leptospirales bacterium]